MATNNGFPRPYTNSVPEEGEEKRMVYTEFKNMGIGARKSGMPKDGTNGIKSLNHVGDSASGKGR